jgi:hypothetical protein
MAAVSHRPVRTVAARLVAASLLGLVDAVTNRRREQPPVVAPAPSDPEDDPLELHLDRAHPERSVAIVRAWRSPWGFPG